MQSSNTHPWQESTSGADLLDADIADILAEYRKLIPAPMVQSNPRLILCAIGLVGAGKTTVIKPVSEALHLGRISTDELRNLLRIHGFNFLRTLDLAKILTKEYLDAGLSIALDGDGIQPEVRSDIRKAANHYDAAVVYIHINPPESFIIYKLKHLVHYTAQGIFRNSDEAIANFERRKPLHEKYVAELSFDAVFDTSREDLPTQIDAFIKSLRSRFSITQ